MVGSEFITAEMCRLAHLDAADEGINGMLAVCFVIRNRQRAGWFGGNWIEILSHHRDSSYKLEPYSDTLPDPRSHAFQMLLQEATGVFSGAKEDTILASQDSIFQYTRSSPNAYSIGITPAPPTALYFGRLSEITNPWFLTEISRNTEKHRQVATVGTLTFFT